MADTNQDKDKQLKNPSDEPTDEIRDRAGLIQDYPAGISGGLILADQFLPPNLFVLPVNNAVVFPTLMIPLQVTEPRFAATVEEAISRQRVIGIVLSKEGPVSEKTTTESLYDVGVVAKILKRLKMPDGSVNLLIHSMKRFRIKKALSEKPHIVVEAEYLEDEIEKSNEMDALTRSVIGHVKKLSEVNPFFTEEMRVAMINAPGPGTVADLVAFALTLPREEAQKFLETTSVKRRFEELLVHLRREQNVADLQKKISDDVNNKVTTMQREFFLREQMKVIKRELGMEEDGKERLARTFYERIEAAGMPEDAKRIALEELQKFESLSEQSPEYNVTRNYLETIVSLPWSNETEDNLNLEHAREVLDADHYGLEKVKDRILEFLAVRRLRAENPIPEGAQLASKERKGSIIVLVGPPGVGKTSIGRSIAKTMGRSFFRFSLGGMRDEAEIKGHRRTYIGAMPGKIIQAMKRAGSKNPVLMLDEIDKLGQSFQGDPASALLEVLDPEQNSTFLDHYLDIPYDLSNVLFVATANSLSSIPEPLLDRMEIIEIPGYTLEEKEQIASRYVIPKVFAENGLKSSQVKIGKAALHRMMTDYAREPGLRTTQQLIAKIARKAAMRILIESDSKSAGRKKAGRKGSITIGQDDLVKWLGPKRFYNEMAERITVPGIVVGLAWTAMGGDILFIEATDSPGSGGLRLTGQMGGVMTESANIAWTYVKRKTAMDLGLSQDDYKNTDFHLHIPAGAIPKDGPSAGVTMASALYSLLTGRVARQKVAMTGELSLTGKVLPVGGIKEKILAARRAGITTVILPKLNEKDLADVPKYALKGLTVHLVSRVEEVFDLVLCENSAAAGLKHTSRILRRKIERIEQREDERATERGERALVARAGNSGAGKAAPKKKAGNGRKRVSGKAAEKNIATGKSARKKTSRRKSGQAQSSPKRRSERAGYSAPV